MRHLVAALGRWFKGLFVVLSAAFSELDDPDVFTTDYDASIASELLEMLEREIKGVPIRVQPRNGILFVDISGQPIPQFLGRGYFQGVRVIVEG